MRRLLFPSLLAGALSVAPEVACAQAAVGITPSASLASRGDSLKELRSLDAVVQRADAGA
jgi:hypothetical protein